LKELSISQIIGINQKNARKTKNIVATALLGLLKRIFINLL
jgi:hypothetical protein